MKYRVFIVHPSGLLTDYQAHGDGLLSYRYIRELAARGHHVCVACERSELMEPPPPNVEIYPIASPRRFRWAKPLSYIWKMRSLFNRLHRERPFDLAHQLNPVYTGLSLGLLGSGIPLVLGPYVSHWASQRPPFRARISDAVSGLQQYVADAVLVSGRAAQARVHGDHIRSKRMHTVPYGIDLRRFPQAPLPSGDPCILYLAGLTRYKGIFVLLEAFESIAAQIPAARLLIVGGQGDDGAQARDVAQKSAYHDRIMFVGEVLQQDVPAQLARATVFCLPSLGEPYGMSLVEAMATGRAVVATNAGGPVDLVDPQGGILVPMGDAPAFARAVVKILTTPDLPRSMGDFNRQAVRQYDWPQVIDKLEAVYDEVVRKSC
jgi:glycosyltransferase involved in cell wall biosynthesis